MTKSKRVSGLRQVAYGVAAGLVLLVVGDRGAYTAAPAGIDPLEVLNVLVRPNALVVLDSSGSMRERPEAVDLGGGTNPDSPADGETAGDDPTSKLAIAKNVLRTVVQDNQATVSFRFGRYTQTNASYGPERENRFLYTAVCANSDSACNTNAGGVLIDNTGAGCANAGCGMGVFRASNFTFNDGTRTTYHLYAGKFFNGETVSVRADGSAGTETPGTASTTAPFVDVQTVTAAGVQIARSIFTYRGIRWNKGNDNNSCGGFEGLTNLPACTYELELNDISPFLRPEIPLDPNGNLVGYTNQAIGAAPGADQRPAAFPTAAAAGGIRASGFTPIAETLIDLKTEFTDVIWPPISSLAVGVAKPRTIAIIITDGDDSCTSASSSDTGAAGANDRALRTAHKAQLLYETLAGGDPASSVTTYVIALGSGASSTRANWIAWGGSGLVRPASGTGAGDQWLAQPTQAQRDACTTCRDAFVVGNAAELTAALQSILVAGQSVGEFSDQQSITESIFELGQRVQVTDSPSPARYLNPLVDSDRYRSTIPALMQSTFEMPDFKGHLKAFVNNAGASQELWDAGDVLFDRVRYGTGTAAASNGMSACPAGGCVFDELRGGAAGAVTDSTIGATANARLKRRIYSTSRNGVFTHDTPATRTTDLMDNVSTVRTVLWPPDSTVEAGTLDDALGIGPNPIPLPGSTTAPAALTLAELRTRFGACGGTVAGDIPSPCGLTEARREARRIILAHAAGAQVRAVGGVPVRVTAGDSRAALRRQLQFVARPWVLAESTLAAPAVVTPPLQTLPATHSAEYKLYINGARNASNVPVNAVNLGFGLRSPDPRGTLATPNLDGASLKPVMSVVYHSANDMLHAFRAAPYPQLATPTPPATTTCTRSTTQECGGDELWAFVPYDLLPNLKELLRPQTRDNHTYMLASPVRFSDVFFPGTFSRNVSSTTIAGEGVWRTVLLFGRGIAGKYYTALDVTTPGPFNTTASLSSFPPGTDAEGGPIPIWSRGNPDTVDGRTTGANNNAVATNTDATAYAAMGQTWSVPAIGRVKPLENITVRTPTGIEFAAYTGSGYGTGASAASEGSTFYTLDMLTGDVVASSDVGDRSGQGYENALVGSPAGFSATQLVFGQISNSASQLTTRVYYGDVHGRVWRNMSAAPAAALLFGDLGADQPVGTAPALLNYQGTQSTARPHVFVETGHDNRVAPNNTNTPPFRMYGLRDDDNVADPSSLDGVVGPAAVLFKLDFPNLFRGTAQPATAFKDATTARVFFVGNRFNVPGSAFAPTPPPCVSSFDGILFAVGAESGQAAYDLDSADDRSTTLSGQRVNSVTVVGLSGAGGAGRLVVDRGLGANIPPPPPGAPAVLPLPPAPLADVYMGSTIVGSVPFKLGSTVCK